jgi:hypothetical protein
LTRRRPGSGGADGGHTSANVSGGPFVRIQATAKTPGERSPSTRRATAPTGGGSCTSTRSVNIVLPTLWFRHTWFWAGGAEEPLLHTDTGLAGVSAVRVEHSELSSRWPRSMASTS